MPGAEAVPSPEGHSGIPGAAGGLSRRLAATVGAFFGVADQVELARRSAVGCEKCRRFRSVLRPMIHNTHEHLPDSHALVDVGDHAVCQSRQPRIGRTASQRSRSSSIVGNSSRSGSGHGDPLEFSRPKRVRDFFLRS